MNLRDKLKFWIMLSNYVDMIVRGTSLLSLPDAIANSLSYVKAFGGTEQGLPDGYTQLEYIVFDSTQVIDTGFTPDNNSRIESKLYRTGADCWLYGASPTNPRVTLYHSSTGTSRWGNQSRSAFGFVADTEYTLIQDKNGININGVDNPWNSGAAGDFTCDRTLTIGNNNGSTGTRYFAGNFYYMKIYDNDVLVRDFVPCKNASNVVGLYDKVNGVFYTDTRLVAGATAVPTPDAPMDIVSNNGVLKARHQSGLPLGYTALEYIQSSGSQYIDTGRVPNNDDIIEQKFQKVGSSDTTCSWYGSMPSSQTIIPRIGIGSFKATGTSSASIFAGVNYTGYNGPLGEPIDTNAHILRFQATGQTELTYTYDDVTYVIDASSSPTTPNFYNPVVTLTSYLFARHGTDGVQVYDNEGTKIYYHREYLANGTLMLDMVPVKRKSDNVLGMYDLVSGQFFTNQGTGDFVAGNPVSDPVEIYTDGTVETINAHGKNLFDKSDVVIGKILNDTGAVVNQSAGYYSGHISVDASTGYTVSQTGGEEIYLRVLEYDSTDTMVKLNKGTQVGTQTKTFTTGATTTYVIVSGSIKSNALDTLQLERGSTATEYQPYYDGGTATAEMLLKVGDYQDVQSIIDGVVTRNVGVKVLDGTENWTYHSTTQDVMTIRSVLFPDDFYSNPNNNVGYCNYYTVVATSTNLAAVLTSGRMGWNTTGNIMFKWTESGTSGVTSWKQWLAAQYAAGTPVIVLYPLATATTESVAGQTLQVTAGDNVLEITQASLNGLELEAKYKKQA